jgi:hypothetical protein
MRASTLGLVDYRSDGERMAAYAKRSISAC